MKVRGLALACVLLASCGEEGPLDDGVVGIEGVLVDASNDAPLSGRVRGVPGLFEVRTSTPSGRFRLEGARVGERYRLIAEAQGYQPAEVDVVPEFGVPVFETLRLMPALACEPGAERCAPGGAPGVERCTSDGRGFDLSPCAEGQVCADPPRCVGAHPVEVSAMGSGLVVSRPSGIACPPSCTSEFAEGTSVQLEARPFGDAEFEAWGGACEGTTDPLCTLSVAGPLMAEARFRTVAYRLSVETAGSTGRVVSTPEGIDCPGSCEKLFDAGSQVTLSAEPGDGFVLARWERNCSGTSPTCTLTMSQARQARARFARPGPTLSVSVEGPGRVRSDPAGIDCGSDCLAGFDTNQNVTLTAEPGPTGRFVAWSGACASETEPTCELRMSTSREAGAVFEGATARVEVTSSGAGQGRVVSIPGGIQCGTDCSAEFALQSMVRLEARPDAGSVLYGWGGDCSTTAREDDCNLTVAADRSVDARWEPFYLAPLEVDADCRLGLDFDGADPLANRCGAGTAQGSDWSQQSGSRSALMGDRLQSGTAPLVLPSPAGLASPFTVELSVRPAALGEAVLVGDHDRADPTGAGYELRLLGDGRLAGVTWGGGGTTSATTSARLASGTWTHVALTVDGSGLRISMDGMERAREGTRPMYVASSSVAWVGFARTGTVATGGFEGAIDELRLSTAARY